MIYRNVYGLFLIVLIVCWDIAVSIVAEDSNAGVRVLVAETTNDVWSRV